MKRFLITLTFLFNEELWCNYKISLTGHILAQSQNKDTRITLMNIVQLLLF